MVVVGRRTELMVGGGFGRKVATFIILLVPLSFSLILPDDGLAGQAFAFRPGFFFSPRGSFSFFPFFFLLSME